MPQDHMPPIVVAPDGTIDLQWIDGMLRVAGPDKEANTETAFQQRVWAALREIPAGTTATYADIARKIGAPKSMRAVAGACAANALAVAIPCHRVVKSDGALSGYRWGVERKRALIEREAAAA